MRSNGFESSRNHLRSFHFPARVHLHDRAHPITKSGGRNGHGGRLVQIFEKSFQERKSSPRREEGFKGVFRFSAALDASKQPGKKPFLGGAIGLSNDLFQDKPFRAETNGAELLRLLH